MPDRFVQALDQQTKALDRLAISFEKSHRTGHRLSILMILVLAVGLVLLFGVFSIRSTQVDAHHSLQLIQQATSPQAIAKSNREIQSLIDTSKQEAACSDNHVDRALASILSQSIPTRLAGCSPDKLPKALPQGG